MRPLYRVLAPLFLLLFLVPQHGLSGDTPFVTREQIDFSKLLPPPPAVDSARQQEEMAVLMRHQKTRTPEQEALAQADVERAVFRFADVLGPDFTPEKLPLTAAFFATVGRDGASVLDPAKDYFARPRPYVSNPELTPCVRKPHGDSYPSGHSTFATVTAIILAEMVPEKRAQLFERAARYRLNRVLGGVHYPSDIEAGHIAGTVIAAFMLQNEAFTAAFAQAKAETRRVLGLP